MNELIVDQIRSAEKLHPEVRECIAEWFESYFGNSLELDRKGCERLVCTVAHSGGIWQLWELSKLLFDSDETRAAYQEDKGLAWESSWLDRVAEPTMESWARAKRLTFHIRRLATVRIFWHYLQLSRQQTV